MGQNIGLGLCDNKLPSYTLCAAARSRALVQLDRYQHLRRVIPSCWPPARRLGAYKGNRLPLPHRQTQRESSLRQELQAA